VIPLLTAGWGAAILILAEVADPLPLGRAWGQVRAMAAAAGLPAPGILGSIAWGILVWGALQLGCLKGGAVGGRWVGIRAARGGLESVTALLLGWLGAGLALLGLAVLGLFRPGVLAALAVAALGLVLPARGILAGWARTWMGWTVPCGDTRRVSASAGAASAQWIRWISGITLAAIAVELLAPETHIDALTYHLGIAGRAVRTGKLFAPPGNFLHHLPALTELLRGWGLAIGGEPAARLWTLGALAAGAAAIRAAVVPIAGEGGGWAGFGLWVASPLAAGMALGGKPDVFVAPLAVAAVAWMARGGAAGALVAGLLAGGAAGAKLPALVVVPIVAVTALWGRFPVRMIVLAGAGAAAAVAPWLAKSALLTGDPVYPFGRFGFGMPSAAVDQFLEVTGTMALSGRYDGILRRIASPWTAVMADGLPALWLALVPVALAAGGARRAAVWWVAGALGTIAWLVGPPQPRYGMSAFAWLTVATVAGLGSMKPRRAGAWLAGACLALQFARTGAWCAADGSWAAGLGIEDSGAFRRRALATFAECAERIAALPPGARVMYAGEWRSWPAPRSLVTASLHEPLPAWPLIRAAADSEDLARRWRQLGITHVVHDPAAALYHRNSQTIYPWTVRDLAVWAGFWRRHARLREAPGRIDRQEGGYYMYEIVRAAGPPRAAPTLPGVEGVFAVIEAHLRRRDLSAAEPRVAALEGVVGDIGEVAGFLGRVWYSRDPAAEARYLERADAGGYWDLGLWGELARLAEARGRSGAAAAWRRRAADAEGLR